MTNPFADAYREKRVLVTGHTGFKGSWLTLWLNQLGARVTGFSDEVPVWTALLPRSQPTWPLPRRAVPDRRLVRTPPRTVGPALGSGPCAVLESTQSPMGGALQGSHCAQICH